MASIRTLRLKVQPDDYAWLNAAAREVNAVWNYCNERSAEQAARWRLGENRPFLSGFDLCRLTDGYTEYTSFIGADTIQRVCNEYAVKRKAAGKPRLAWRASSGPRRAPGWAPFKALSLTLTGTGVKFRGKIFRVFELERLTDLPQPGRARARPWRDGCFAQDAAGDWWLCVAVLQPEVAPLNLPGVNGIDQGLKDAAVDADGWRVPAPQFYRRSEEKLAQLQRPPPGRQKAGKRSRRSKKLTRLHRKVARQRKDFTHKASSKTVKRALKRCNGLIGIGDVSAPKLAQTRMAKSVLDVCWGAYRTQVLYKCVNAGIRAVVVSERLSTQTCGECGSVSGPKGRAGLKERHWTCPDCGTVHDRDINSARIHRGRAPLALALEASGCHGAKPRRPGGRRQRLRVPNERRASVSGNRASTPLAKANRASRSRGAVIPASEAGKAGAQ